MSAILVAAVVIAIATLAGVAASEVASALSYRLFNATRDGAQYILRTLGGVVGFACGAAAVQTGNYVAALYGPPLAVLWMTAVFLALLGVGKLFVCIFR